jgi:hypothetical protein
MADESCKKRDILIRQSIGDIVVLGTIKVLIDYWR